MKRMTAQMTDDVIAYLREDIENCLYLYIDLMQYGLDDPNIDVWYEDDRDGICLVVLRYYSSIQVYSQVLDCPLNGIIELIEAGSIQRISASKTIIGRLSSLLGNSFSVSYGKIMDLRKYRNMNYSGIVERAGYADLDEIEQLLLTDPSNQASYRPGELAAQLADRMAIGFGDSYIIRKDGAIVAHAAIVAKSDFFQIASLTIVKNEERGYPYGAIIDSFLLNEVATPETRLYAFMMDERRIRMFELMGNDVVAEYGKLVRVE